MKGKGHLVFPRELTTSENMAVHTLAVQDGLVCRVKGEDLNQSLHVYKVRRGGRAVCTSQVLPLPL